MKEKIYEIASTLLPGVGSKLSKTLISYCGSSEAIFNQPLNKLQKIPGIGEKTIHSLQKDRDDALLKAEEIMTNCQSKNIDVLHYTSDEFPERLKQIEDAPALLYRKGNGNLNEQKIVAIVGTRKATTYGKKITEEIVEQLRSSCATIISGLAYGIDITAHKSAIANKLPTLGVLASGVDHIYPRSHADTANLMIDEGGALLSENIPGTKPDFHLFPERNRIIAGMADAVIVVEAAKKGGALITAEIAHSYEKPVFAVPGNLGATYSEGCNYLIKSQKGYIYTGMSDIEYLLNWEELNRPKVKPEFHLDAFDEKEKPLIKTLLKYPDGIMIDELSWKAQISMNEIANILLQMEFQGLVKSLPGKRFKLKNHY